MNTCSVELRQGKPYRADQLTRFLEVKNLGYIESSSPIRPLHSISALCITLGQEIEHSDARDKTQCGAPMRMFTQFRIP